MQRYRVGFLRWILMRLLLINRPRMPCPVSPPLSILCLTVVPDDLGPVLTHLQTLLINRVLWIPTARLPRPGICLGMTETCKRGDLLICRDLQKGTDFGL